MWTLILGKRTLGDEALAHSLLPSAFWVEVAKSSILTPDGVRLTSQCSLDAKCHHWLRILSTDWIDLRQGLYNSNTTSSQKTSIQGLLTSCWLLGGGRVTGVSGRCGLQVENIGGWSQRLLQFHTIWCLCIVGEDTWAWAQLKFQTWANKTTFFPEIEPSNFYLCLVRAAHSRLRVPSLILPNLICHISVLLIILSSSPVIPAKPFPRISGADVTGS